MRRETGREERVSGNMRHIAASLSVCLLALDFLCHKSNSCLHTTKHKSCSIQLRVTISKSEKTEHVDIFSQFGYFCNYLSAQMIQPKNIGCRWSSSVFATDGDLLPFGMRTNDPLVAGEKRPTSTNDNRCFLAVSFGLYMHRLGIIISQNYKN